MNGHHNSKIDNLSDLYFTKDFSEPDPIDEKSRAEIDALLQSGRLFRYQIADRNSNPVSVAEVEFAKFVNSRFALGVNSGGCALTLAIKIILESIKNGLNISMKSNNTVMTNAYTLSPVPGAIVHAGGVPLFIECDQASYSLNFESLKKVSKKSDSKILLLSYMRGRIPPDLEDIVSFCHKNNIMIIEDCAHTLGCKFRSKNLGNFGDISAYSLQTNKLINCGEGGFLCTDCPYIISKAIVYSGSYANYGKHLSRPDFLQTGNELAKIIIVCSVHYWHKNQSGS